MAQSKTWTIVNCFLHAGFTVPGNTEEFQIEILEARAESQIQEDKFRSVLPQGVTFADYLHVDDGIIAIGDITDGDIVDSLANACKGPTLDEFEGKVPTSSEILNALRLVQRNWNRKEIRNLISTLFRN